MSVINDFYPIDKLKPLNGLCDDFHTETKKLQRPYVPISVRSYHALFNTPFNYYQMPGRNGRVVTFGNADGGYALMPLNRDAADDVLKFQ